MTSTVVALLNAACAAEAKPPDNLPVLADALQDGGIENRNTGAAVLAALRAPETPAWLRGRWLRRVVAGELTVADARAAYDGLAEIGKNIKDDCADNVPDDERMYYSRYAWGVEFDDLVKWLDEYVATGKEHCFGFVGYADRIDHEEMWRHYSALTGWTPPEGEEYDDRPFRCAC